MPGGALTELVAEPASELTPPNAKPRTAFTTLSYHERLGELSAIILNPIQETVAAT